MSMETTCLKCRTVFRVTTEQLNAHQGDVRCGMCGTLFNAFDSLAPARTELPQPAEEKHVPAQPPVAEAAVAEAMPEPEVVPPAAEPSGIGQPQPEPEEESFADFEAALERAQMAPAGPQAETGEGLPEAAAEEENFADFASAFEPAGVPVADAEKGRAEAIPSEVAIPAAEPSADKAFTEQALSPGKSNAIKAELAVIEDIYAEFARKVEASPLPAAAPAGEKPASGVGELPVQKSGAGAVQAQEQLHDDLFEPFNAAPEKRRSWWWGIAVLPLLLSLAAQLTYFYRVDLAARYPASRPMLEQACAALHCDVPLPRNADLLKIESSDLEADTEFPSRVTLSSVVSNRAAYRQAYPQLELTLTNHADQLLARRIFGPAEYLAAGADARQGMAANSEVAIRLSLDLGELNAVGYRLYVFYVGQR